MRFTTLYIILHLLASCSHSNGSDPKEPTEEIKTTYNMTVDRFLLNHLENGWVVSRYKNGEVEHEGDSLLWSGIALASLPCSKADPVENALIAMLDKNNGGLTRYEPLPDEYKNGREISFDGAVGFYFGVLSRIANCDSSKIRWVTSFKKHLDFLRDNDWHLNSASSEAYVPGFTALRDMVTFKLGLGDKPSDQALRALESLANVWSSGVIESRSPCFRVHLSLLHLLGLELSGDLLGSSKDTFCYATEEVGIPFIDYWCGRITSDQVYNKFQFNKYEYQYQRCNYESEDVAPDLETPALDLLFALSYMYPDLLKGTK